jgi:hypothetical protein
LLEPNRPPTDPALERSAGPRPRSAAQCDRETFSMARRGKGSARNLEAEPTRIEGERLKPIRQVMREIERPDGTILRVKVPVYPPFKLKDRKAKR